MKNNTKNKLMLIGVLGVLFGRILNRVVYRYMGDKGSNIAFAISLAIVFSAILILVVMKYYMAAIMSSIGSIPLIVGGIGLYLNNMDLVGLGILLIFIIFPILIKVIPKLKKDR